MQTVSHTNTPFLKQRNLRSYIILSIVITVKLEPRVVSIETLLSIRQMHWVGRLSRMQFERRPKAIFFLLASSKVDIGASVIKINVCRHFALSELGRGDRVLKCLVSEPSGPRV